MEIGTKLFRRGPHGIELTRAGQAFLKHARNALQEVDAATRAARRADKTTEAAVLSDFCVINK